jgi:hypothetical protein
VAANIAARLRGDDAETLHRLGAMPPRQVRAECRKLVDRRIRGRLHRDVTDWLDRADAEAERRHEIVHAIWLRVDKPEAGAVACAHFGPKAARQGHATVGHYLLLNVEDWVVGSYVEPPGPQGPDRPVSLIAERRAG